MDAEIYRLGDDPHGAMFLVLAYLPLFELLAMSQVCKSLKHALNNDVWPWLKAFIVNGSPLNSRLSDDALLQITCKANGKLTSLALIDCVKITDDGLVGVVAKNPLINKLHIPNCTGITPEGVLEAVKTLYQQNGSLKSLIINGIRHINKHHLDILLSLLEINQTKKNEKRLYSTYRHLTLRGDQETNEYCFVDVEICPICHEGGMVFDCPRLTCNQRRRRRRSIFSFNQWGECRGCYHCIPRCEDCGNCVTYGEVREAACGDHIVCNVCWVHRPKCDICNKAYCNQHTDRQCTVPAGSFGFVCDNCLAFSSQHRLM